MNKLELGLRVGIVGLVWAAAQSNLNCWNTLRVTLFASTVLLPRAVNASSRQ